MQRLAEALAALAVRQGAEIRCSAQVAEVRAPAGRVEGVRLADGEDLAADAVLLNADVAAAAAGLLGQDIADAVPAPSPSARSLSAVTWSLVARAEGFSLLRHNVFFSSDYPAEFADIFERRRLPHSPTVYVCAQDRGDPGEAPPQGPERLFCLVNAPACGDGPPFDALETESCAKNTFARLEGCGLHIERQETAATMTTPHDFDRLFPGSGGALYGQASHGWQASFSRPGARTRLPGLYLAGGSVHPGPGIPMAAISGRLAAASLLQDLASRSPSRPVAMPGGISMH